MEPPREIAQIEAIARALYEAQRKYDLLGIDRPAWQVLPWHHRDAFRNTVRDVFDQACSS